MCTNVQCILTTHAFLDGGHLHASPMFHESWRDGTTTSPILTRCFWGESRLMQLSPHTKNSFADQDVPFSVRNYVDISIIPAVQTGTRELGESASTQRQ